MDGLGRAAAFLDRDGTLNARAPEHDYVRSPEAFAWLPGAAQGAARLAAAGFRLFVVSNQRGVARRLVDVATLTAIERRIQAGLAEHGARIEAFRYCPHDLAVACDCRKPAPGLILGLAAELDLDLQRSWMIGDAPSDVAAGRAAGCATVLLDAAPSAEAAVAAPDLVAPSLAAASELILTRLRDPGAAPQELGAAAALRANSSTSAE
jgi:D-glycero-D-manno-heptose 1,7-bisphosphate phosphatase